MPTATALVDDVATGLLHEEQWEEQHWKDLGRLRKAKAAPGLVSLSSAPKLMQLRVRVQLCPAVPARDNLRGFWTHTAGTKTMIKPYTLDTHTHTHTAQSRTLQPLTQSPQPGATRITKPRSLHHPDPAKETVGLRIPRSRRTTRPLRCLSSAAVSSLQRPGCFFQTGFWSVVGLR